VREKRKETFDHENEAHLVFGTEEVERLSGHLGERRLFLVDIGLLRIDREAQPLLGKHAQQGKLGRLGQVYKNKNKKEMNYSLLFFFAHGRGWEGTVGRGDDGVGGVGPGLGVVAGVLRASAAHQNCNNNNNNNNIRN
jgi:hypothetical protein